MACESHHPLLAGLSKSAAMADKVKHRDELISKLTNKIVQYEFKIKM